MKFLVTLLIAILTFATADAAKVDIYKSALQNKTFTIKYKINEFPVRNISKDFSQDIKIKTNFWGKRTTNSNNLQQETNTGGVIVFNKDDSYLENFHDAFTMNLNIPKTKGILGTPQNTKKIKAGGIATLFKDGETFVFLLEIKDDGTKNFYTQNVWGGKSSKVQAVSEKRLQQAEEFGNPYVKLFQDYNFGNPDLYLALQPILPPEQVIVTPNTPTYKFVSAGNLDGGLTYEDFYGEKNNTHCAIRYYFSGNQMTKIATFTYIKNERGVQYYEKHVIDIEEFLTTADENYLQLPANLQDTTKRDKDGGKK